VASKQHGVVEQKVARGAQVLLDVPPALWPGLPQALEAGYKLVTRVAVLQRASAAVDILLAFNPVLAPFQRRVRLLPGFPVRPRVRVLV
jgi:hypothetical protein